MSLRDLLRMRSTSEATRRGETYPDWLAYEPSLIPPPSLMRTEGITVLEEWFRWGEEWSMLLRSYGRLGSADHVLEIGCGLGRIAFPLRYLLSKAGRYTGFDITAAKIEFLSRAFTPAHPNFRFILADVYNSYYNPTGVVRADAYRFPSDDSAFDLVYAASVFTHMVPENAAHYFRETARVLKPGGRAVFSFFLLDHFRREQARPHGFSVAAFDFAHRYREHGDEFATVVPENPEQMTAYRSTLVARMAADAGLTMADTVPGLWSGTVERGVAAQDLVVLTKPPVAPEDA
jgi:SAM-dependent methyltransferase